MFRTALGLFIVVLTVTLSVPRAWADGTPTPEANHGERIPAGDASIRIVFPVDGAVFTSQTVIVKVETTNWPLGNGKHWHLYVNGQAQGMSQGSNPSLQANDLLPGANVLEAVMSNGLHQELDAVAKIVVQVEISAPAAGNPGLIVAAAAGAVAAIGGAAWWLMRKK